MPRPRVLVIEDDIVVADLVARIATNQGYTTRTVSGLLSSSVCTEFKPDVIVLDIFMPEIDGFEVLQFLANSNYQASIIILSSTQSSYRKMAERMAEELGLNIVANVAKPFTIWQLQEIFENFKKHPSRRVSEITSEIKRFANS